MTETIIGNIIGILGVISVFWFGYEVGKFRGLSKAEKIFDEAIKSWCGAIMDGERRDGDG